MAGKDLELKLRITADGKVAVEQLGGVARAVNSVAQESDGAGGSLDDFVRRGEPVGKLAFGFNEVMEAAQRITGALGGTAAEMLEMAESVQLLESRLGLAVEGFGDAETAMADVRRIANDSGQALDSVGDLYVKVAGAAESLGLNQQQVATVTETVSRAMRVAGADGQSAAGAIQQFSQALTGGTFRAEEFNSVVEAAPYFVDQLAKGLGVARDELKSMVDAGLISSKDLAAAVQQVSADIEADYAQLPRTVGQAMTEVRNELALYVAGLNEASGITETLSGAIGVLADNVSLIGPAAAAAAAGGMAKLTQAGIAYVASLKQEITASLEAASAQKAKAAADLSAAKVAAENAKQAAAAAAARLAEAKAAAEFIGTTTAATQSSLALAKARAQEAAVAVQAATATKAQAAATLADLQARAQLMPHLATQAAFVEKLNAAKLRLATADSAVLQAERALAAAEQASAAAAQGSARNTTLVASARVELAAATKAANAAELQYVGAQHAAAGASAAAAAKVGILSRALSLLSGPAGILLVAVAGFAAFALSQRDAKKDVDALTASIEEQYAAFEKLGQAELTKLEADLAKLVETTRTSAAQERELAAAADAAAASLSGRNRTTQRLAQLEEEATNHRAEAGRLDRELVETEQRLAEVRAKLGKDTADLASAEGQRAQSATALIEALKQLGEAQDAATRAAQTALATQIQQQQTAADRAKALGDEAAALDATAKAQQLAVTARQLDVQATEQAIARIREEIAAREASGTAKASELAALNQTLAGLGAELDQRRALVVAAQEEARQALLTAQTYGDQSASLNELIAARDRLTAAINRERAAGGDLAPLLVQLAELNTRIKDAADDATAAIERKIGALRRDLDIARARIEVERAEIAAKLALAEARGDEYRAAQLRTQLARTEIALGRETRDNLRAQAQLLREQAEAAHAAAMADGTLTDAERDLIEEMRDRATMAELAAQKMDIDTDSKRKAIEITRDLTSAEDRLSNAVQRRQQQQQQQKPPGTYDADGNPISSADSLSGYYDEKGNFQRPTYTSPLSPENLAANFAPGEERKLAEYLRSWTDGARGTGDYIARQLARVQTLWADQGNYDARNIDTGSAAQRGLTGSYRQAYDSHMRTLRLEVAGKSGTITGDAGLLDELERQASVQSGFGGY